MQSVIQVTSSAVTHDLTVLATVKTELGITGTSEDNKLLDYIRKASSQIATYCNRVFGKETVIETFPSVSFANTLRLRRRPVISIASVTENGGELGADDYYVDKEAAILFRKQAALLPFCGEVIVTYDAGYLLLDGVPHAIERACIMLVSQYYFGSGVNPYLRSEDIPGVASYSYGFGPTARAESNMPPEVEALLAGYKELCVA